MATESSDTTAIGFRNKNGQLVVRNTGKPGTDHLQYIYQLACSKCGHNYGANGADIHERKCPACQGGAPGFTL
jgi:PHP family Zn ribbon phosphoesterase